MTQHNTLTKKNWTDKSICFQIANIGSEIERTISWKKRGNTNYSRQAFDRALELIDLTLAGALTLAQFREITRIRELLADWYIGNNSWKSTDESWQKYFLAFAVAARNQQR